jgi:hypothetical protein
VDKIKQSLTSMLVDVIFFVVVLCFGKWHVISSDALASLLSAYAGGRFGVAFGKQQTALASSMATSSSQQMPAVRVDRIDQVNVGDGDDDPPPPPPRASGSGSLGLPRVSPRPVPRTPPIPRGERVSLDLGHTSPFLALFSVLKDVPMIRFALVLMLFGGCSGCYSMEHPPSYPDWVLYPDVDGCVTGENCPHMAPKSVKLVRLSDDKRCQTLSDREILFEGIAAGTAVLGGSSGLGSVWTESKDKRIGLAIGGVVSAGVAAAAAAIAHSAAVAHAAECGHAVAPSASSSAKVP